MKKLLLGAAALSVLAALPAYAADPVDAQRMAQDIKILSSDAFEGRGPATEGEKKTVAYIAEQMKAAGLQPGGDLKGRARAWTQDVPLARFTTKGPVNVSVKAGGETQAWAQGEQIAIRAAQTGIDRLTVKDAPVVFVGYGVTAPEKKWDDFKGYDLKGKVALVLVNDPDFETGEGDFGGKAMTYYGRWTYKYEEAARQGAVGFLVIHEREPASYGWATVKNSNTNEIFDVIRKNPSEAHAPLEGWVQRDNAVDLFRKAGLDFEALKKQAQTRDFRPVELRGVTFSTDYAVDAQKVVSKNVVGVLPGKTRPDERVFYTAHWDHLGVGLPDAKGDRIYNGAVDNASGTAALIELGRAFAKGPRPDRSIVFLAVTAEEKGLLGTEYYADNPLYPLGTTVADLNMDGMNLIGPARDVTMSGNAPLTLQDDLIKLAAERGLSFSPDPNPQAGSFYRSDHFPFAKRGVPAISFGAGETLAKGGAEAGKAASEAYIKDKYHQPADEYDPNWDLTGLSQEVGLFYEMGRRLANSNVWPEWKEGAEFKAERDKTRSMRR
ncbi:M28 family metallopeptidase [Phenylobacterium sp.]|uniref:M28 family metallopeptidase n=1 Tax=Phenylobacterium sp. TaxID=1871053 RepID=UPI002CA955F9|nr:M28 family metallopeptidase [Phenylobacterium sp.]HVI34511.1 M28 family metallopeptidase [Phenylobacterium sp.]